MTWWGIEQHGSKKEKATFRYSADVLLQKLEEHAKASEPALYLKVAIDALEQDAVTPAVGPKEFMRELAEHAAKTARQQKKKLARKDKEEGVMERGPNDMLELAVELRNYSHLVYSKETLIETLKQLKKDFDEEPIEPRG